MSFYDTGNPVPSIDPRDLDDNAKHVDELVNSTLPTFVDRLGVTRRTLAGIEADNSNLGGNLLNSTDPAKGANLVGYDGRTVRDELNDLAVPITRFGAVGDWNGTTGTNNKDFIKDAFNSLSNYSTLYIPAGRYLVDLLDSDVTDLGFDRDYAYLLGIDKTGVILTGPGEIHVRCSGSTKRVVFCVFKNSVSCGGFQLNLTGDLVKVDAMPNSETGVAMGFMFYNCFSSGLIDCRMDSLLVPAWFTGEPISPATVTDVSKGCFLRGNYISNYEQCSTFGAGAFGLDIQHNHFVNAYTAFKVSQNPSGDAAAGKAGMVNFSNNEVYWTEDAQFAAVFFAPTFAQAAVGLMIECANTEVQATDNLISLADVTAPSLPVFGNNGPIVIFESPDAGTGGVLSTRRVTIKGGTCTAKSGYGTRFAIDSTSNIVDLTIQNVTTSGGIRVQSGSVPSLSYGTLTVKGNVCKGVAGTTLPMTIGAGRFRKVEIEGNSMTGIAGQETSGNEVIMLLNAFTCEDLVVTNNNLGKGTIGNFGGTAPTCANLVVTGNTLRSVDLATIDTLRAALNNDCITTGTANKLVLDAATKASCRVSVGGSCSGPGGANCSTALNLNGGLLRLNSTEMFANSGSAFVFDASVVLQGGEYYGNGAPTQQAIFGSRYVDFAAGSNGAYLKTTSSGTSGWFRQDTFISGSSTVDIPSIAANGTFSFDVTVTGAVFGNTALATGGGSTGVGLIWSAQVSAADTVKVSLYNPTGVAIDPASQTITVRVFK